MPKKPAAKSKAGHGAKKSRGKRAMKDLSPRNAKDVKGGLSIPFGKIAIDYHPQ